MDARDTNQMSQSPSLCRSGCGFYGNPSSDGLCSKCYKDAVKRKQSAPTSQMSQSSASSAAHSPSDRNNSSSLPLVTASPTVTTAITTQDNKLEGSAETISQSNAVANASNEKDLTTASSQTPQTDANGSDPPKTNKKKKNRCTKCKVNVGVIGFPCRCGGTFCSTHRYANEHNCTFDYREHGAEEIRKNNPQVIGEKVTKI